MSAHQLPAQLADAFTFAVVPDPGDTGTIAIGNNGICRCDVVSTGGVTVVLPDHGYICLVHNSPSGTPAAITINDTDGNTVATLADGETALCLRVGGDTANHRWQAAIFTVGIT